MAQIGCCVPAASARIGVFDAIYARMGARDDMSQGHSTFMVELQETSDILRRATDRSLVILDELGRGTSTHDGVAIAHGTLEHIITQIRCTCLFVTHYPILTDLAKAYKPMVESYYMAFFRDEDEVCPWPPNIPLGSPTIVPSAPRGAAPHHPPCRQHVPPHDTIAPWPAASAMPLWLTPLSYGPPDVLHRPSVGALTLARSATKSTPPPPNLPLGLPLRRVPGLGPVMMIVQPLAGRGLPTPTTPQHTCVPWMRKRRLYMGWHPGPQGSSPFGTWNRAPYDSDTAVTSVIRAGLGTAPSAVALGDSGVSLARGGGQSGPRHVGRGSVGGP